MSEKKVGSQIKSSKRQSSIYNDLPLTNKSDSFPLINSIADQNQFLKKEIQSMKLELSNLSKISQYILTQNLQLKSHFQNKTNDIRNYINSLQINTNQEMQDTYHQIHLLSQSNWLLVKHIESILLEISHSNQNIKQLQLQKIKIDQQLISLRNEKNMQSEAKMQTTFSSANIQKLAKYQDALTKQLQKLEQQTEDLSRFVGQIKYQNDKTAHNVKRQVKQCQTIKQETKQVIIYTINHIKELRKELQKVESQFKKQEIQHARYLNRHNQIQLKVKKLQKQRAQHRILWQKQQLQISLAKQRIINLKRNFNQFQIKKHQKQQEKQQLEKVLIKKRNHLLTLKQSHHHQVQVLKDQFKVVQANLKNQERNKQLTYIQQINMLKQSKLKLQENSRLLKQESQNLNTDFDQYNKFVKGLDNPASEIQRIQMRMRLKEGSKPLASIF